ncbi:hypothetical protein U1Q18_046360 [Sarracenia purpurea var. burkii]
MSCVSNVVPSGCILNRGFLVDWDLSSGAQLRRRSDCANSFRNSRDNRGGRVSSPLRHVDYVETQCLFVINARLMQNGGFTLGVLAIEMFPLRSPVAKNEETQS